MSAASSEGGATAAPKSNSGTSGGGCFINSNTRPRALAFTSAATAAALGVTLYAVRALARRVNEALPQPYVDEIFHVPLALARCAGNSMQWHPLVTTPAGLYRAACAPILLLRRLGVITSSDPAVGITYLRSFSTFLSVFGIFPLLVATAMRLRVCPRRSGSRLLRTPQSQGPSPPLSPRLVAPNHLSNALSSSSSSPSPPPQSSASEGSMTKLAKTQNDRQCAGDPQHCSARMACLGKVVWNAVNAWLMPVSFFYYFVFYTDSLSTFLVLLCHLLALYRRPYLSALVGLAACNVRQTNIVWLGFSAASSILADIKDENVYPDAYIGVQTSYGSSSCATSAGSLSPPSSPGALARNNQNQPQHVSASRYPPPAHVYEDILKEHRAFVLRIFSVQGVKALFPAILALAVYAAMVAVFGLVQGDQEHHRLSFHVSQMFYLAAFIAGVAWPAIVSFEATGASVVLVLRMLRTWFGILALVAAAGITLAAVRWGTYEHPFILSDNRHVSFYLWRYFFRLPPHAARYFYALLLYPYAAMSLGRRLLESQPVVFASLLTAACAAVLIPSPLLELRYFIVPYLLYRVHVHVSSRRRLAAETAWLLLLNAFLYHFFFNRPFTWASEPSHVQRLIW